MSRFFDNASSQYLRNTSFSSISGAPVTLACWVYCDEDGTNFQTGLAVGGFSASDYYALELMMDVANNPLRAYGRSTASNVYASADGLVANQWCHVAGVYESDSSRYAYVDGTPGAQNTTAATPGAPDEIRIGSIPDSSFYMSGGVAECGVWDVALTAPEISSLAAGFSPLFIRPQNLVFYAPLYSSEDFDRVNGYALTPINAPTTMEHPLVFNPTSYNLFWGSAVAGGISIPIVWHHLERQ